MIFFSPPPRRLCEHFVCVFVYVFVSKIMQEGTLAREEPAHRFGGNLDHVTLGLGLRWGRIWVTVGVPHHPAGLYVTVG